MTLSESRKRKGKRGEPLPETHEGLPDSTHQSGLCPRCGKQSSFEIKAISTVSYDDRYAIKDDGSHSLIGLDRVAVLLCRHCNQGTVVIEEKWIGDHPARERAGGGDVFYRGIHWWPLPESHLSKDIPEDIAGAFAEVSSTLHAQCPRAAVVMARRTLEAVTADKGEKQGNLIVRLKNLATNGILSSGLSEWAHEVRLLGNAGAHYDPLNQVSMEDASELVSFLRELLHHIYELPARLKRLRSSHIKASEGETKNDG